MFAPIIIALMLAILALPALGGWLFGRQQGIAAWLGAAICCLPAFLFWLVITGNAGDPPDLAPSTVLLIVSAEFLLFAIIGSFVRELRTNRKDARDSNG